MSNFRRRLMMQQKIPTVQEGWVDKGLAYVYLFDDGTGANNLKFIQFTIPDFGKENIKEYYKIPKVCDLNEYQGIEFVTLHRSGFTYYHSGVRNLDISDMDMSSFVSTNIYYEGEYSNALNYGGLFTNCSVENIIGLDKINTENIKFFKAAFMQISWYRTFYALTTNLPCYFKELDLTKIKTNNVVDMSAMFGEYSEGFDSETKDTMKQYFKSIQKLDLSSLDSNKVEKTSRMFACQYDLSELNMTNFNTSKLTEYDNMFINCFSLNKIICNQSFKDWCITNQDIIALPEAMREGGSGTWEIVN